MDLEQVNVVGVEAAQAFLYRAAHGGLRIGPFRLRLQPHLSGDINFPPPAGQAPAQVFLGTAAAIHWRSVKKVDTQSQSPLNGGDAFGVGSFPPDLADAGPAKPHFRNLQAGAPQGAVFHIEFPLCAGQRKMVRDGEWDTQADN